MPNSASIGLQAPQVLLPDGWATDVAIYWDKQGVISDIQSSHVDSELPEAQGPVVPGMVNVHSHAFQNQDAHFGFRSSMRTNGEMQRTKRNLRNSGGRLWRYGNAKYENETGCEHVLKIFWGRNEIIT